MVTGQKKSRTTAVMYTVYNVKYVITDLRKHEIQKLSGAAKLMHLCIMLVLV